MQLQHPPSYQMHELAQSLVIFGPFFYQQITSLA
jgi:hypothetical protein